MDEHVRNKSSSLAQLTPKSHLINGSFDKHPFSNLCQLLSSLCVEAPLILVSNFNSRWVVEEAIGADFLTENPAPDFQKIKEFIKQDQTITIVSAKGALKTVKETLDIKKKLNQCLLIRLDEKSEAFIIVFLQDQDFQLSASLEKKISLSVSELSEKFKQTQKTPVLSQKEEYTGNGVFEINLETASANWSNAIYAIFSLDGKNYIPAVNSIENMVHPDDQTIYKSEMSRAFSTGNFDATFRIIDAQGQLKKLRQQARAKIDGTGKIVGFQGSLTEVNRNGNHKYLLDRGRKDVAIEDIIESSNLCIWKWNVQTDEFYIGRKFAEMIGYEYHEKEPVSLNTFKKHLHPNDRKSYTKAINKHLSGKTDFYECELRIQHKKGDWLYIMDTGQLASLTNKGEPEWVYGALLDITKRKNTEQHLKKTQEMLAETNRVARTGGWSIDLDSGQVSWTKNTYNVFEVPLDTKLSLDFAYQLYEEGSQRKKLINSIETAISEGKSFDVELMTVSFTGRKFWTRVIGHIEEKKGKVKRLFGTIQDINEQKENEIALEQKTREYNELVENIPVGVYSLSENGKLTFVNNVWLKLMGFESAEEDLTVEILKDLVHPDDKEVFLSKYEWAVTNRAPYFYECRFIIGGKLKWFRLSSTPKKDGNGTWYWFGTLTDITEQTEAELSVRRNESQLKSVISTMQEGLVILNQAGKILTANQSAENILGGALNPGNKFTTASQVYDKNKVPLEDEDLPIYRALKTGQSCTDVTLGIKKSGSDDFSWISLSCQPLFQNQSNTPSAAIATFKDITKKIHAEKALLLATKKAEDANKAKSAFLANMSHEIRTPLNGVIGFSDLLIRSKLNDTQKQYVKCISHSAKSLMEIINDILDFSKIEAGKVELSPEPVSIANLSEQVLELMTYQAHQKGLELTLDLDFQIPNKVLADDLRLRQILVNLLGNAIKFTKEGEVALSISQIKRKNKKFLRFAVTDSGIGIEKKNQKKIFEAFEQAEISTSRKFGGTGLGLSISNKLLKLMGSKLQIRSKEANGSTFYFDLDLQITEAATVAAKTSKLAHIKTILALTANNFQQKFLNNIFSSQAVSIDVTADFSAGLEFLRKSPGYDLILVDQQMSSLSGLEFIKNMKTEFKDLETPIILMHRTIEFEGFKQISTEIGIKNTIIKPLSITSLLKACEKALNKDQTPNPSKERKSNSQTISTNKFTILIAEDNPVNLYLLKSYLKNLLPNVKILQAGTGNEAVALYKSEQPDLILMDIQMPEMNGVEATRIIRSLDKESREIPIIALTADALPNYKAQSAEAGLDDFIMKPIMQDRLAKLLTDKLDIHRSVQKETGEKSPTQDQEVHFNQEGLKKRLNYDEESFYILMQMLEKDFLTFDKTIKNAIKNQDIAAVKSTIHKLKGTASSACFDKLLYFIRSKHIPASFNEELEIFLRTKILEELSYLINKVSELKEEHNN